MLNRAEDYNTVFFNDKNIKNQFLNELIPGAIKQIIENKNFELEDAQVISDKIFE
jgi:hypothetical protein